MLASLVGVLLLAAPVTLAVNGFTVAGFDQAMGDAYGERLVTLMGQNPALKLISQKDIAQVLGLERQRQLMGCANEGSCFTELSGALGADAIFLGTLAKGGSSITATLRVLRASDGAEVAATTARLDDDDALQDWLEEQVPVLSAKVLRAFGREDAIVSPTPRREQGAFVRWVPAIAGAAAAIGGAACFVVSRGYEARLRTEVFASREAAQAVASTGQAFEGVGLGLMIAGAVAVASSLGWVVFTPRAHLNVAALASPGGALAVIGGSF
jgi:hypothetical protein